MEYSQVDVNQQRAILKGRIAGWEADHWGHEINLVALRASGTTEAGLEDTLKSLSVLEASILAARDQLSSLGAEETSDNSSLT